MIYDNPPLVLEAGGPSVHVSSCQQLNFAQKMLPLIRILLDAATGRNVCSAVVVGVVRFENPALDAYFMKLQN